MTASTVVLISIAVAWMCMMCAIFLLREWEWQERPRRFCRSCRWVCQPDKEGDGTLACPICQASHPLPLESDEACAYFLTLRHQPSSSRVAYRSHDGGGPEEEVPMKMPVAASSGGRLGLVREVKRPASTLPYVEEPTESLSR